MTNLRSTVVAFIFLVAVSATALAQSDSILINPSPVAFPDVAIGSCNARVVAVLNLSFERRVIIQNLRIIGPDSTHFRLSLPSLPATLDSNGSAAFQVSFCPLDTGMRTAKLAVWIARDSTV